MEQVQKFKAVKHAYQLDNYLIRANNDDLLFTFFPKDHINHKDHIKCNLNRGRMEPRGYDNGHYDCHKIYLTNLKNIVFVHK